MQGKLFREGDTVCKPLDPPQDYSIGQICNSFLLLIIKITICHFLLNQLIAFISGTAKNGGENTIYLCLLIFLKKYCTLLPAVF